MNKRFEELLPWYANGTLGAEERAWVDAYLEQNPEARSELDWYRSLQQRVQESAPAVPATIGLARAMRLIQGDRPTLGERIGAFFGNFGMRPSYAMAGLALVAVQGGVILNLLGDVRENENEIRALHAVRVEEAPMLKISFAPDAKEADIRMLVVQVHGELAGGPGQLGDYYLRVPAGTEAAALARVQAAPIVQAASLAPGVPPRE
ncbi:MULTISPECIES: anti-sigma factor family protein [unclassified Variovorax]|uniref:anti-sigma factor family protein n=1 Tax=unclassified Variovorax TaxID=663243 RepID=UPI003ECDD554